MDHYHLLFTEKKSPGSRVIQAEHLDNTINNSNLIFENWGDFYSEIPVSKLAEAFHTSLSMELFGEKTSKEILILDSLEFKPELAYVWKDYIIKETHGIRFYSPTFQGSRVSAEDLYFAYSLMGVRNLFSDKEQGNLQIKLKKFEKDVEKIPDLISKIGPLIEDLNSIYKRIEYKLDNM